MPLPGAAYATAAAAPAIGEGAAILGSSIIGGLGSAFSGKSYNRAAKKAAREQMKFQEYMSNTAHQREVKDLRAAGLNPILSANSGASTPSGAMADVMAFDPVEGAMKGASTASEIRNKREQTALIKSQVDAQKASAKQMAAQTKQIEKQTKELLPEQIAQVRSQVHLNSSSTVKQAAETDSIKSLIMTQALDRVLKQLEIEYKPLTTGATLLDSILDILGGPSKGRSWRRKK